MYAQSPESFRKTSVVTAFKKISRNFARPFPSIFVLHFASLGYIPLLKTSPFPCFPRYYTDNYVICTFASKLPIFQEAPREDCQKTSGKYNSTPTPADARLCRTILRSFVHLEPPNPRLHRLALHLAIPGVSAGADRLPDNHQITASLAECLEANLAAAAHCCCRHRRCRDLGNLRSAGRSFWRETAERLTDNATALARPHSVRSAMMPLLFPPVGGRVGGSERIARSTLAFTV